MGGSVEAAAPGCGAMSRNHSGRSAPTRLKAGTVCAASSRGAAAPPAFWSHLLLLCPQSGSLPAGGAASTCEGFAGGAAGGGGGGGLAKVTPLLALVAAEVPSALALPPAGVVGEAAR